MLSVDKKAVLLTDMNRDTIQLKGKGLRRPSAGVAEVTSPAGRYIRYRITFTTTNSATAILNDITFSYT